MLVATHFDVGWVRIRVGCIVGIDINDLHHPVSIGACGRNHEFHFNGPSESKIVLQYISLVNEYIRPTGSKTLVSDHVLPLIDAGLLPAGFPISVNAVSGYSGGGKSMIESYEVSKTAPAFELYALGLEHKHIPELMAYARLERRPIFIPSVGNFKQGMLVSVPLHLDLLPGNVTIKMLEEALAAHYARAGEVRVMRDAATKITRLDALALNATDALELYVFGKSALNEAVLVARLDNLGKGAAGAAVQNLKLMLALAA